MDTLRISLIQSQLYWENPILNRQMFSWKIRDLGGETDVIILPEMFTSGFTMFPEKVAESPDGPTISWMQELSHETGAAITGSLVIHEGNNYYNRLIWVEPEGRVLHYDKNHLFSLAGEDHHYTAGTERLILAWKGWSICPLICYDLRFPEWSRNTDGIDLLIYVANWPEPRRRHWQQLLIARAIENQCYVAGVNRIGRDDNDLHYCGDTTLVDYQGETLCQASFSETILTTHIVKNPMNQYRERLPFLADLS
ncbi:MAG: amidohydrolase [Saprospiraceae bacterium]|nr:amidohydrolase [Saprospiraceae bacterium]